MVCLLASCLVNTAFAIAPLTQDTMKQAQLYGSSQANTELFDFLKPWLSYEENAEQLNENAETAHMYTPFLLIAMDAREKRLHNQAILIENCESIITNYLNTLSFSVKLYGNTEDFPVNTVALLKQNGKLIKAWSAAVPQKPEPAYKNDKYKYMVQSYFYFKQNEIDPKEPLTLVIMTGDKGHHRFYFETDKIK